MKKYIIILLAILLISTGVYFLVKKPKAEPVVTNTATTATTTTPIEENRTQTVIGESVEGRDIIAYHFGEGEKEVLFIGGIHGGYAWNTTLLSYELIEYLKDNPSLVENIKVTVIPTLNPDGLDKVTSTVESFETVNASIESVVEGRFNENKVDLNRNFACGWKSEGVWQNKKVSGGDEVFSEPESQALKNYVEKNEPDAVIAYYTSAGGVFASNCNTGVLSETLDITNLYAKASGYKAYESFDFYETTGDMVNWFASRKIPAISVLLTSQNSIEWSKNKAGIDAILEFYSRE